MAINCKIFHISLDEFIKVLLGLKKILNSGTLYLCKLFTTIAASCYGLAMLIHGRYGEL